jgi:hypothetical protein
MLTEAPRAVRMKMSMAYLHSLVGRGAELPSPKKGTSTEKTHLIGQMSDTRMS